MNNEYNVEGKPLRLDELNVEALAQYLHDKKVRTSQGKLIQPLHDGHLEVLSDPARFKVLAAGRRFGKSLIVSLTALAVLFQTRRRVWICAPDYSLCEKVFRELYNILVTQLQIIRPGKPKGGRARAQKGDYYLETPWGSVLEAKSLENPDSLAGEANDLVIVDEAALNPNIYNIWTQMIKPTLMDKEGSAIFISCLTKDTWINTENGLEKIKNYISGPEIGMSPLKIPINTGLGKMATTDGFWTNEKTETKKITLGSGTEIEGTLDHPLLAIDSRTGEVEWTSLKDLDLKYHYIARDRNTINFGNNDSTDFFKYDKRENSTFNIPYKITPDLAYLMGLILGDGYINKNYTVVCSFDEETKKFLESSPCGLNFFKEKRIDSEGHYKVCNKKFSEFLYQFGFLKEKSSKKQIPYRLFQCSEEVISNFLSGLFDTNGCATKGKKTFTKVKYTTTSKELYKQVLLLTQSFGMYGSVYEYTTKPPEKAKVFSTNYNIEWTANNAKIFFDKIGFRLIRKQELREYCNTWSTKDGIPGISNLLKKEDICIPSKLGSLRNHFSPSYKSLDAIQTIINKNSKNSKNIEKVKVLLEQRFYWDNITSIEDSTNITYDFKVPTTESFWANAIVSHNTPRGRNGFFKMYLMGQKGKRQREGILDIIYNEDTKTDDDLTEWSSFKKTSYDNPLLASTPEKSKAEIDKSYREAVHSGTVVKFKQEYLADFEAVSDIVFPDFKTEKSDTCKYPHVVDYNWHPNEGLIFAACDHNFAKPASTIFAQVNKHNDVMIFDEAFTARTTTYMQGQQIADKEKQLSRLAKEIWTKEKYPMQYWHPIQFEQIVADISGNQVQLNGRAAWDDIEAVLGRRPVGLKQGREIGCNMIRQWMAFPEFDQKGRPVLGKDKKPITYPKLFISHNCPNLIHALSTAKFKQSKQGVLKEDYDESPEGYEGLLDALRYLLVYLFHDTGKHLTLMGGF